MINYAELRRFAEDRFLPVMDLLIDGLSHREAAAEHGEFHRSTIDRMIARLQRQAENDNDRPPVVFASEAAQNGTAPYILERVTSTISPKNGLERQYLKTRLDEVLYWQMIEEGVKAFISDTQPLQVPMANPTLDFDNDIIPWIQIGDAHLNMLAWAMVSGENFDLKTAESDLINAIGLLIDELPMCARIVINDLGDFTHSENIAGVTEGHGHLLDCDKPYPSMIRVYSRVMRFIVTKALTKAIDVDILINQGNHSRKNDMWMAELLRVAFEHTGRVHVLDNDGVFIPYRMGNTLVLVHHTDKTKPKQLAQVMITDYRTDFGETEFHYIDGGHVHHGFTMKEHPSIVFESWNHLAPLDKYAYEGGWRNRQSVSVVFRSRSYGDLGRRLLPIQQLRDKVAGLMGTGRTVETKRVYSV